MPSDAIGTLLGIVGLLAVSVVIVCIRWFDREM